MIINNSTPVNGGWFHKNDDGTYTEIRGLAYDSLDSQKLGGLPPKEYSNHGTMTIGNPVTLGATTEEFDSLIYTIAARTKTTTPDGTQVITPSNVATITPTDDVININRYNSDEASGDPDDTYEITLVDTKGNVIPALYGGKDDDYRADYIQRDDGKWNVHRELRKAIVTSVSDMYETANADINAFMFQVPKMVKYIGGVSLCKQFTPVKNPSSLIPYSISSDSEGSGSIIVAFPKTLGLTTVELANAWITNNIPSGIELYYLSYDTITVTEYGSIYNYQITELHEDIQVHLNEIGIPYEGKTTMSIDTADNAIFYVLYNKGAKNAALLGGMPPEFYLNNRMTSGKLQGVVNLTTSVELVSFLTGEITSFDATKDYLEVYMNSIRLTRGVDYTITSASGKIKKMSGTWDGTPTKAIMFEFLVGKNQINNINSVARGENVVTVTSSVSSVTVAGGDIASFIPATDYLEVYRNTVRLIKGTHYNVNTETGVIDSLTGPWVGTAENPLYFHFIVTRNQTSNLVYGDGKLIEEGTIGYSKIDAGFKGKIEQIEANILSDIVSPIVSMGMNSVVRRVNNQTSFPKFTIHGKDYVNLLGKDGNCEDVSKWSAYQCTLSLDSTNKVFGGNGIKITLTNTSGASFKVLNTIPTFDATKYYFISASLKNGNLSTGIRLLKDPTNGGSVVMSALVTNTTAFVRTGIKVSPSNTVIGNSVGAYAYGTSGQYGYCDGIQVKEISVDEYNNLTVDQLMEKYPYVDSYACLENPYIEIRHDNLVINGNCEEGIGWWEIPEPTVVNASYSNGYIQITRTSGTGYSTLYQKMRVKPNATYVMRYIAKISNSSYSASAVLEQSDDNTSWSWFANVAGTNSATDVICTGTFTPTKPYLRLAILAPNVAQGTIVYFKEVQIVEGTTAPISYKPCRIERCVIEGKFTSDDSVTYENGKVDGLRTTDHKKLYGKDYDWLMNGDGVGLKEIRLVNNDFCVASSTFNTTFVKYDGTILKNNGESPTVLSSPNQYRNDGINLCLSLSDTDTGFSENVQPNDDEIKAIMNGWKTVYVSTSRYCVFCNVNSTFWDVNAYPPKSVTTNTVAYANNQTSITVADGNIFKVGDYLVAMGYTNAVQITSINGNVLVVPDLNTNFPIGSIIARVDGGTDLRNVTYCKNNVAPGYEGYQFHYKFKNPEPLTDINTHIHGDIPKFDTGDNYLYLDSGMVLGEATNPALVSGTYYINGVGEGVASKLKNKSEIISSVYKNALYDSLWSWGATYIDARGNGTMYTELSNFDTKATYTVDYQILKTMHTTPANITLNYTQDILGAIAGLAENDKSKQTHDSSLDNLIDLSMYEKPGSTPIVNIWGGSGYVNIDLLYLFTVLKRVTPVISIAPQYTLSVDNVLINDKALLTGVWASKVGVTIRYTVTDSATVSKINSNGVYVSVPITADCRERC